MKKISFSIVYSLIIFILLLSYGCKNEEKVLEGNGKEKTEERKLGDFTGINLAGDFSINLQNGEKKSLKITADENLLPEIIVNNKENYLYIQTKEKIKLKTKNKIKIELVSPKVQEINLSGSNILSFKEINNEAFLLKNLGKLEVSLSGKTGVLEVDSSGSLNLQARDLYANEVKINSGGLSEITLTAEETLRADISGKGKMDYYGSPENISINKAGKIEITKKTSD